MECLRCGEQMEECRDPQEIPAGAATKEVSEMKKKFDDSKDLPPREGPQADCLECGTEMEDYRYGRWEIRRRCPKCGYDEPACKRALVNHPQIKQAGVIVANGRRVVVAVGNDPSFTSPWAIFDVVYQHRRRVAAQAEAAQSATERGER